MQKIFILNGSGGVGKDSFVAALNELVPTFHCSVVDVTKSAAKLIGWDGQKTEKDRKFLSNLKDLIDAYNDNNYRYIQYVVDAFKKEHFATFLVIDMREREQIDRAVSEFGAQKILVKRDSVEQVTSNHADAGVYDVSYDYTVDNNGTLDDLKLQAEKFVEWVKENAENA